MLKTRYSKREVDKAGEAIAKGLLLDDRGNDPLEVLEYWRGVHMEPLHKMMDIASGLMPEAQPLIAGRIKKFDTVVDKLKRPSTPSSLKSTFDIAGCRVLLPDLQAQREYCSRLEALSDIVDGSKTRVRDYLKVPHPSGSGYRSKHIICKFTGLKCDQDLFVEVQVRTNLQHAWATALELFDKAAGTRFKFGECDDPHWALFKRSAELIKQLEENGSVDLRRIKDLCGGQDDAKSVHDAVDTLEAALCSSLVITDHIEDHEYTIVDFFAGEQTVIATGVDAEDAMKVYQVHERSGLLAGDGPQDHDTVLVRGGTLEQLWRLYPNYFGDISEFTNLVPKYFSAFV